MLTPNRLDAFLKVMQQQSPGEWTWNRVAESQFWYVDHESSYPPMQFLIEFNDEMLYAQYLLRDFRIRADCWLALYRFLLRLNEELSLVKLGLNYRGQITMMGELPGTQFSLDTFQNLLRLMVYYLEKLYWEIGIVAVSEDLAMFLTQEEDTLAVFDNIIRSLVQTVKVEAIAK